MIAGGLTKYTAAEHRTTVQPWGMVSEMLYGSAEEKYLGFGDLVQLSRMKFFPGMSSTPMTLLRNIEVIDVVLSGIAGYQDSSGVTEMLPDGTLQVVSAGKGIYRSEFNASPDTALEKLQIGILPRRLNAEPVRSKALFDLDTHRNTFISLVSPYAGTTTLSIRQQAAMLIGKFDAGRQIVYDGSNSGMFLFVVSGIVTAGEHQLHSNDGIGLRMPGKIAVTFAEESVLLLLELDMSTQENT